MCNKICIWCNYLKNLFYTFLFSASKYEIKLFCEGENGTNCDGNKMVRILNTPDPTVYGTEQKVDIHILNKTKALFVSIAAKNEKNKESEASNIVQICSPISIPPVIMTETPEITTRIHATSKEAIAGYVIGGIVVATCITVAIVYFNKRKTKKRSKKSDVREIEENVHDQEVTSGFNAEDYPPRRELPLKKIETFPVLLYTHDQIKDIKDKNKNSPLYKSNIPPKAWASLDAMANKSNEQGNRDTKSLSNSSTLRVSDEAEINKVEDKEIKF